MANYFGKFTRAISVLLLAILPLANMTVAADATEAKTINIPRDEPEAMLKVVTDELLSLSKSARSYAKQDPERYYREVNAVVSDVIDFDYFSRSVMATYASARQYNALKTDEEKSIFRDRIKRFSDAMQRVLLVKYSDAVLAFVGERIDLSSVIPVAGRDDKVSLQQTIYDQNKQTYKVQYSLHKTADGWQVYNVIIEGVNLGGVYRTQFAEAIEKQRGDIDYVIDHWVDMMAQSEKDKAEVKK